MSFLKVFDGRKLIDLLQKANLRRETALQKAELLHLLANFLADEVAGGFECGEVIVFLGCFLTPAREAL